MKRVLTAIALAVVIPSPIVHPTASEAQPAPQTQAAAKFSVEYREPRYLGIYQRVRARKVLEELAEFMSPLRLKHDLKLQIDDDDRGSRFSICRGTSPNAYYDPERYTVHICYSYLAMLENEASVASYREPKEFIYWTPAVVDGKRLPPTPGRMPGFTRGEVIVGGTVSVVLHELGHAIRHNLDLPRLGREEDTADQIAGYIMLKFGKEVALPTIKGTINTWHHMHARTGGAIAVAAEADEHSLSLQRALTFLCLAYGSPHSAAFKALADRWLPDIRKDNCANEYNTVELAFEKTILEKHVDPVQLKKVLSMKILQPGDLK